MSVSLPLVGKFSDQEVQHICDEMGIQSLDTDRRRFINCLDSVDVSACPGSGKTTLAVAKLMLLVRNWSSRSQGVCVLSHTNVAKDEISNRFSSRNGVFGMDGKPHFVGTIHSFLSRFIASPYLISIGCPPKVIDSKIALKRRISLIPPDKRWTIESFLGRQYRTLDSVLFASIADINSPLDGAKFGAKKGSTSYDAVNQAIKESIQSGYLTDDEVLLFAKKGLEVNPGLAEVLCKRFPFLILDEAQDTSGEQMEILETIFNSHYGEAVVQRLGDINQSIFTSVQTSFPGLNQIMISDSFRFNSEIANNANRFALTPIEPDGLKGLRESENCDLVSKHFILFDESEIDSVLPTFAQIVKQNLTEQQIVENKISAVGSRHRNDGEEKGGHFPRFVGHYYPDYAERSSEIGTPWFSTFHEYVLHARNVVANSREYSAGVEVLALGALRAVHPQLPSVSNEFSPKRAFRGFKQLIYRLNLEVESISNLFLKLLAFDEEVSRKDYGNCLHDLNSAICAIVYSLGSNDCKIRSGYFNFPNTSLKAVCMPNEQKLPNEFIQDGIRIEIGSIHSIKGETHAATLLLETFTNVHFVKSVLPWLTGKNQNGSRAKNPTQEGRLRLSYVALTRPKYIVGVAAPLKSLGTTDRNISKTITALENQGWAITRLQPTI